MQRRGPPRRHCKERKTLAGMTCKLIKNLTFRITTCIKLFLCFPLSNVICPCGGKGTCNKPPDPCAQDLCADEGDYVRGNSRRNASDRDKMTYYAGSDTKLRYSDTNCAQPRRKRSEDCIDVRRRKRYDDECEDTGRRKIYDGDCEDNGRRKGRDDCYEDSGRRKRLDDDCDDYRRNDDCEEDEDDCEPEPECPDEDRGRGRGNYPHRNRSRPRPRFDENPGRQRYSEPNVPDNGCYQSYDQKYRANRPSMGQVNSDHRMNAKPYRIHTPDKQGVESGPACCKGVRQIPIRVERR